MPVKYALLLSFLFPVLSFAESEEVKTTYQITSSFAAVTTLIKKASAEREEIMRKYPFEGVAEAIRKLPMVTGVEYNPSETDETVTTTYSDFDEHKRSYPAVIRLNLPASVTLPVRIEEIYRTCKSPADKPKESSGGGRGGGAGGGGSSSSVKVDCALNSSVKIKGPTAVYGNFASSVNLESLLRDQQSLEFNITRDYLDKTSLKLESKFSIVSEMFDKNLFKFMEALSLKPVNNEDVYTRANILLGTARVLRVNNERMLSL
jgi:hypothetical protein